MSVFRNVVRLSAGDFVAKTLNFLAFVCVARVAGVTDYGVIEFARAVATYFLVLADGGLEVWATREAARGADVRRLAGQLVPLRLVLAIGAFGILVAAGPGFPDHPPLRTVLILYGLTLFTQALSLKWVFMGRERLVGVAAGLVLGQVVFASGIFALVRSPADVVWIPLVQMVADLAMAGYFGYAFARAHGGVRLPFTLRGGGAVLQAALPLGASHTLGLMSFNFDAVLLGFFRGPMAVGWYGAAYKPVTMVLAIPVTYFVGLFPALARTFRESPAAFRDVVVHSLRLSSMLALPVGVGGAFLAGPVIALMFGPAYANSAPALQLLSWSATLVILRGTFRQALNAADRSDLDLKCTVLGTGFNLALNLVLIPTLGIVGAALATVASDVVWLATISVVFSRHVTRVPLRSPLLAPAAAATAMGIGLYFAQPLGWLVQGAVGLSAYGGAMLLLGAPRVLAAWRLDRARAE